ncbi:MAG: VC1465 family Xer recombination activation factor [Methylophilaceae bacterium]
MPTKKHRPKWIDPESFYLSRRRAGLTVVQAAESLDVTTRTIRNWENGSSRIPYAAFRLIRMMAGYSLVGKQWEGWSFWKNALWTPEGRRFEAHELRYVRTYIGLARHYLKTKNQPVKTIEGAPSVRVQASAATAASGVRPVQNSGFRGLSVASQQRKNTTAEQSEKALHVRAIDGAGKIAANDDVESEVM